MGAGPPWAATEGAISATSTHAAPRVAHGQSTTAIPSMPVSRMLSARRSVCRRVSPRTPAAQSRSRSMSRPRWRRHQSSARSRIAGSSDSRCQQVITGARSVSISGTDAAGLGVSASCKPPMPSRTILSWSARHGRAGRCPSTSLNTNATQMPSSYVPISLATGAVAGSAAATRASRRWMSGLSGFCVDETALTNARLPSALRIRAAAPGENPPRWVVASATGHPTMSSTAARTMRGRSCQANRTPSAATIDSST